MISSINTIERRAFNSKAKQAPAAEESERCHCLQGCGAVSRMMAEQAVTADGQPSSAGQLLPQEEVNKEQGSQGEQHQEQAWRTLVVLEDAVGEGCEGDTNQQHQQQRQVFVVKGRLSKAYIWKPGDANSIVDIDVSERFSKEGVSRNAQQFQAIACALLRGQEQGLLSGVQGDDGSFDPQLFIQGGTYLEPRTDGK